jgi:pyridoxamine 5'-phosphate oxidase
MDPRPAPAFQDDLPATLAEAWRCLRTGVASRRSAFHHPTVATIGRDGFPRARTMILRAADPEARCLRFHTDLRGEKVAELAAAPRIAVHAYDPGHKLQVRVTGFGHVHHGDEIAREAWRRSQPMSQACYGVVPPPGATLSAGGAFALPEPHSPELAAGEANFAVLMVQVMAIETLYLAHRGHRRARFVWSEDSQFHQEWLSP